MKHFHFNLRFMRFCLIALCRLPRRTSPALPELKVINVGEGGGDIIVHGHPTRNPDPLAITCIIHHESAIVHESKVRSKVGLCLVKDVPRSI